MIKKIFSSLQSFLKPSIVKDPDDWRNFSVKDGKIVPPYHCEVNVVDHCNIACLDCNHASPVVGKRIADPEVIFHDLSLLAKSYKAVSLKVIGGEPLLHPDLLSVIRAIRKSGICSHIVLYTNGILLHQMNNDVWNEIDEIELSVYPGTRHLLDKHMSIIERTAKKRDVKLSCYYYKFFRATFSTVGTSDEVLIRRIYRACSLANEWGCQSIYEGYFFKCPQSIYISRIIDQKKTYDYKKDGIKIGDDYNFQNILKSYLMSKEPLTACRYCLACAGRLRAHSLLNAADWKSRHAVPTEDLVDHDKLHLLEKGEKITSITSREKIY